MIDETGTDRTAAADTPVWWVAALGAVGVVLVALVPLLESAMGLGLDGTNTEAQLLGAFAFIAGVPLGLGLALLAPALTKLPGWRVGVGLLLVTWVAVLGGLIGASYTSQLWQFGLIRRSLWDTALTVGEVGVVPGLIGLILIATGVRSMTFRRAVTS